MLHVAAAVVGQNGLRSSGCQSCCGLPGCLLGLPGLWWVVGVALDLPTGGVLQKLPPEHCWRKRRWNQSTLPWLLLLAGLLVRGGSMEPSGIRHVRSVLFRILPSPRRQRAAQWGEHLLGLKVLCCCFSKCFARLLQQSSPPARPGAFVRCVRHLLALELRAGPGARRCELPKL